MYWRNSPLDNYKDSTSKETVDKPNHNKNQRNEKQKQNVTAK
jgi:hypothetical protein